MSRYFLLLRLICLFFFFNDPATTEISTLSLHDALPISTASGRCPAPAGRSWVSPCPAASRTPASPGRRRDRKSTRLNSSHRCISYAVFCLKKKKKKHKARRHPTYHHQLYRHTAQLSRVT